MDNFLVKIGSVCIIMKQKLALRETFVRDAELKQPKPLNFRLFPGHLVVEGGSSQNHGDLVGPL